MTVVLPTVHKLGPYSRKVLTRLRLKVKTFVSSFCPKTAKVFVLSLVVFTKAVFGSLCVVTRFSISK